MAKKSYTVTESVRVNNVHYAIGAHLQCEESDLEGIEHCVTPGKPKPAPEPKEGAQGDDDFIAKALAEAQAEAEAKAAEEARRAALTQEQRDAEDVANAGK